jgi:uncharacterized Tic20 family protein
MDEQRQPEQPGSEPGSSAGPAGMPSAPGSGQSAWDAPSQQQQQGWQGSQGPAPYGSPPAVRSTDADARQWALIAHVLAGITTFVGPLIIWAIKKDEHPFGKDQTTEALNFGITLTIAQIVLLILATITAFTIILPVLIGFIQFCVWVVGIVLGIMGGLKARDGVPYRYPFNIRLVT